MTLLVGLTEPSFAVHSRYTGTGHPDITKQCAQAAGQIMTRRLSVSLSVPHSEWITHQHRDTYASIIGHPPLLSYVSVADGESIGRAKFEMCEVRDSVKLASRSALSLLTGLPDIQRMLQPCGPPPAREDD